MYSTAFRFGFIGLLWAVGAATLASAASDHDMHANARPVSPSLGGQYAFATIAEIVGLLERDPHTDWSRVDIAALREHLLDMHRVTLETAVQAEPLPDGVRFVVSATTPAAIGSIQRMSAAHAMTMDSAPSLDGVRFEVSATDRGADVVLRTDSEVSRRRVLALGFHGVLALGDHHPRHHLALARGLDPHEAH